MIEHTVLSVLIGLIGLCLGSFAVTAALRTAKGDQAIRGRSRCDHCDAPLGYGQTLPVLSYVQTAGVCPQCGGAIDRLHLVGEVAGAIILLVAFLSLPPLNAALTATMGLTLLASAVVDVKIRRLPDLLTVAVLLLGLGLSALTSVGALAVGGLASFVTFAVFEGLRRLYLKMRGHPGLGFGDVKLAAALAAWLGLASSWAVALAAGVALLAMAVVRPKDGRLAFGPALAVSGWAIGLAREAHLWAALP